MRIRFARHLLLILVGLSLSNAVEVSAFQCDRADFQRGDVLVVNPGQAQNVRERPTINATIVESVPEGEYVTVWGESECADGYTWWRVEYDRQVGWTAEAPTDGSAVWLSKVEMTRFEDGGIRLGMSPQIGNALDYRDYETNHGDGFDDPAHRLFTLEEDQPIHHPSPYQGYWQAIPPEGGFIIAPRTDIVNQRPEIGMLQSLIDNPPFSADTFMTFIQTVDVQDAPYLAYLPLLGGAGQRWIGYPDPRGLKGDRYVPVPGNFKYFLEGLSGDGAYYIAAMFPVAVTIEIPHLPDLPADRNGAEAGYADYLQSVNTALDALEPDAFQPRLALLDAMMRSIEIMGNIEIKP